MKYYLILFICLGYFLTSGAWARHHGHRQSRQPRPGPRGPPHGPPQNAPLDLEALDALGIPRPPQGRTVHLNRPDQARYDAYIENKRNNPAGAAPPQEDPNGANGNPYNAGAAEVDGPTIEKDKEEIIEELMKQAEIMINDEGDDDAPLASRAEDSIKVYFSLIFAAGTLSLLTSSLMI